MTSIASSTAQPASTSIAAEVSTSGPLPQTTSASPAKADQTNFELSKMTFTLGITIEEWASKERARLQTYVQEPLDITERALAVVDDHLKAVQKFISLIKPERAHSGWDFTLKNGSLEVQGGNLSEKDKQWLENVLNYDDRLVSAVKDYYGAVVKYYEYTSGNDKGFAQGNKLNLYHDVAQQIDGHLRMRDVMKTKTTKIAEEWEAMSALDKSRMPKPYSTRPYGDVLRNAQRYLTG